MKSENSQARMDKLIAHLEYEQEKANKYFSVAGVMLMVLDENGFIKLINKRGCEILEADEKDVVGKNWFEAFLTKEELNKVKIIFSNTLNNLDNNNSGCETKIISAKGNIKTIRWFNTVLKGLDGNNIEILSSGEDITEKKRYEAELLESNLRFQNIFEKAPLGYQSLDANGNLLEVNQTWANMLGYEKSEVIGKPFVSFLAPKYKKFFKKRFEQFKKEGRIHSEFAMIHKDGSLRIIEFEGMVGYDKNHNFVQTYCNLNDITQRHQSKMRLKQSEESLKLAQSIAKIGSWELDIEKNRICLSDEARKLLELDDSHPYNSISEITKMIKDTDSLSFKQSLEKLIHENAPCDITFEINTATKSIKYINCKASLFTDSKNDPVKVIGVIRDITNERNKQLELEHIIIHDYLTNLYNRRYYFEQFSFLDQEKFYPLGIMMMDVNGLKIINDAFGHAIGDEALQAIGTILKNIFGPKDIVSRIGGDEFAALIPNTTPETLLKYKEAIVSKAKKTKVKNIELSLAVGYEIKHSVIEDIDELQRLAENHMYKHKTTVDSSIRSKAITAILETLTNKFEDEKRHSFQVSKMCKQIGQAMRMTSDEVNELEQAGLFHDIGKISIPDEILKKTGKLTSEEYEIIKSHTEVGYQILRAADEYSDLAIYALHHHERWDGTGYPKQLKGEKIPLFARVITVVDAFEAMTANRPYRKKMSKESAICEIKRCAGTQFDPKIARIFVEKVLNTNWE